MPEWRHKDATSVTNPALTTIVDRDKMLYQVLPSRIFWNAKKKIQFLGALYNSSIQIQIDEHRILPTQ